MILRQEALPLVRKHLVLVELQLVVLLLEALLLVAAQMVAPRRERKHPVLAVLLLVWKPQVQVGPRPEVLH